jgi:hypothetical protein
LIHQALAREELLPHEHLTDTNYAEAKDFINSRLEYGIDMIAPTEPTTNGNPKSSKDLMQPASRLIGRRNELPVRQELTV